MGLGVDLPKGRHLTLVHLKGKGPRKTVGLP